MAAIKSKARRDVIFSTAFDFQSARQALIERYVSEGVTDSDKMDLSDKAVERDFREMTRMALSDERMNLDIRAEGEIVALVEYQLHGRKRHAFQEMGSRNVNSIFKVGGRYGEAEFYCDGRDVRAELHYGDRTESVVFRQLRGGLSGTQRANFMSRLYCDKVAQRDITRYTRSLRPLVAEVYGW